MSYKNYGTYLAARIEEILKGSPQPLTVSAIAARISDAPDGNLKNRIRRALATIESECHLLKEIVPTSNHLNAYAYKISTQHGQTETIG